MKSGNIKALRQTLIKETHRSFTRAIQSLCALSLSDANTASLVQYGVLDLIGDVLNQGAEIAAGMVAAAGGKVMFPYVVHQARESVLRVLLNLALSDKVVRTVVEHAGIRSGMVHAGTDQGNLNSAAALLLGKLRVRLKMLDANEQHGQGARGQAFAASQQHVMVSYCWEQQDVVLRIKAALVKRGYTCWLDVEQMSGSTVDAMADAIDHSYALIYGISLDYKESANCRLEAMYAHQAKVKMVPMLLQENYVANGWLGMLLGTVRVFRQQSTLDDAIGSHTCSLEASRRVTNSIPLGCPLLLPGYTVNLRPNTEGTQMWYGFFGSTLTSHGAFDKRIQELCRALGSPDKTNRPRWKTTKEKLLLPLEGGSPKLAPLLLSTSDVTTTPRHHHLPAPLPFTTSTPVPAVVGGEGVGMHASGYLATAIATPTPTPTHAPTPTFELPTAHSNIAHDLAQGELGRARESIARLEDRQNRSFCEELSAAKTVARLESELKAKDRELIKLGAEMKRDLDKAEAESKRELAKVEADVKCELLRLEAEMKVMHAARLNDQLVAATHGRHLAYASVVAVAITAALAGIAVWRK
jgi:hypothetical protein